jgi:hypothetical protein
LPEHIRFWHVIGHGLQPPHPEVHASRTKVLALLGETILLFEIAGLSVSGINTIFNLHKQFKDWRGWKEEDVEVDNAWLDVAIEKGVIMGKPGDYEWTRLSSLPTAELKGTKTAVVAINEEKRIRYRIVLGSPTEPGGRLILTKKL